MRVLSRTGRGLIAIATVGLLALTACSSPASSLEGAAEDVELADVTLKVGVSNDSVPAVWEASGALDDVPYNLEWVTNADFGEGAGIFSAFESGAIDLAWNGAIPVSSGIYGDVPFTILSVTEALPDPELTGGELITPIDSDIHSLEDLRGRTIAVAQNSGTQYFLDDFLEQAGIPLDEVNLQFVDPWDAVAAFSSGQVDAWYAYGAYTGQFLSSGDARVVIDGNGNDENGKPTGFTKTNNFLFFWFARNESLANPGIEAALDDFIGRASSVNSWANANVDELEKVVQTTLDIDETSAANAAKLQRNRQLKIDDDSIAHLQTIADASTRYGILPGTIDVEPYFDNRFNAELTLD